MTIRLATEKDLSDIQQCAELAYQQYVEAIGKKPAPMVADFAALVQTAHLHVSHDDNDKITGFIAFYPQKNHMHLENVAVMPEASGQGIGKKLIAFCEEQAGESGLSSVELYTNEKMLGNLTLYPYLGYQEIGRWEEDGFNRVFFRKIISTE